MKHPLSTVALALIALVAAACGGSDSTPPAAVATVDGWQIHGAEFAPSGALPLADALARPAGESVVVEGEVKRVCQASGCWLDLADGEASVRVHFENADGSRFYLPKDGAGGRVLVHATIEGDGAERTLVADGARFKPAGS
jgi:hypothetical protein